MNIYKICWISNEFLCQMMLLQSKYLFHALENYQNVVRKWKIKLLHILEYIGFRMFFFFRFAKLPSPIFIYDPFMNTERPLSPPPSLLKAARALCPQNVPVFLTLLVIFFSPLPPPLPRGFKIEIGPPYPNATEMGRFLWITVKTLAPCRCLGGHVKEPYQMSIALEPDRRSNFLR